MFRGIAVQVEIIPRDEAGDGEEVCRYKGRVAKKKERKVKQSRDCR